MKGTAEPRNFKRVAVRVALVMGLLLSSTLFPGDRAVAQAPPHIQTAQTFLLAWGHQRWDELRSVSADQVTVRIGPEKTYTLEPMAQKSDVTLVFPFRGLSTVRVGEEVKGIAIEEMGLKVGDAETRGPGTITLEKTDGGFRVVGVSAGGAPR